jgi:hypothetical protein
MQRRGREADAGLVFGWRAPGGSFGRTVVGVMVAGGLFAGTASIVRVKGPERRQEAREAARIVVLRASDAASRELLDWARFHSPFPDRWEPAPGGRLAERMAEVTSYLEKQSAYEARLRPRLVEPEEPALPGLIADVPEVTMTLGESRDGARPVAVKLPVKAISEAVTGLGERWGRRVADWERDNAAELMGSEARFMVGVTPGGDVELCMLVDKSRALSKQADVELERWIRGQELAPDPEAEGLVWGMVWIRLEPEVVKSTLDGGTDD